jgi:hypothetical protein
MSLSENDIKMRQKVALDDCQTMIAWYDKNKRTARTFFYVSQICTIVLSALTPVLILWSEVPKPLQALPAAIASIAAALNAVFRWRENWVLRAHASEALRRELVKYKARVSEKYQADLADQTALNNFVTCIESLSMNELSEWRVLQLQSVKESNNIK